MSAKISGGNPSYGPNLKKKVHSSFLRTESFGKFRKNEIGFGSELENDQNLKELRHNLLSTVKLRSINVN